MTHLIDHYLYDISKEDPLNEDGYGGIVGEVVEEVPKLIIQVEKKSAKMFLLFRLSHQFNTTEILNPLYLKCIEEVDIN